MRINLPTGEKQVIHNNNIEIIVGGREMIDKIINKMIEMIEMTRVIEVVGIIETIIMIEVIGVIVKILVDQPKPKVLDLEEVVRKVSFHQNVLDPKTIKEGEREN